ncbi:MAG: HEAT repeat domain-containing protein [Acidobacteria bacterium]|nr:HEAT repeat domain-containing protein [Acidobacteriota bacterium]
MKPTWPLLLVTAALLGQQPPVTNAKLETAQVQGGLEKAVRASMGKQAGAAWIGWAVKRIPSDGRSCCWDDRGGYGCGLEGQKVTVAPMSGAVKLEGPTQEHVLLRVEGGAIGRIRSYSDDCPLDAGGLPFHWLTGVSAAESVAFLAEQVSRAGAAREELRKADGAIHAIAQHAGDEALRTLERVAAQGATEKIKHQALFWLGNSRGEEGYRVVARVLREDPSEKVRERAVYALTQSRAQGAAGAIVRAAKEDKSARVRGQALFWLARKAAAPAKGVISEAIEKDPDTEVKKKAVFALTQLPKEEGTPLLIQLARSHANLAVRKQAMFWLGQSKDPRAVRFFEETLAR